MTISRRVLYTFKVVIWYVVHEILQIIRWIGMPVHAFWVGILLPSIGASSTSTLFSFERQLVSMGGIRAAHRLFSAQTSSAALFDNTRSLRLSSLHKSCGSDLEVYTRVDLGASVSSCRASFCTLGLLGGSLVYHYRAVVYAYMEQDITCAQSTETQCDLEAPFFNTRPGTTRRRWHDESLMLDIWSGPWSLVG